MGRRKNIDERKNEPTVFHIPATKKVIRKVEKMLEAQRKNNKTMNAKYPLDAIEAWKTTLQRLTALWPDSGISLDSVRVGCGLATVRLTFFLEADSTFRR